MVKKKKKAISEQGAIKPHIFWIFLLSVIISQSSLAFHILNCFEESWADVLSNIILFGVS